MSRLPDHLKPPAIVEAVVRYECPRCGNNCQCGVPYIAKTARIAECDKANPGRSTRQVAADLGIPKSTVSDARAAVRDRTPVASATPEAITGRDGKSYPATRQPVVKHRAPDQPENLIIEAHQAMKPVIALVQRMTPQQRTLFRQQALERIADAMVGKPDTEYF